MNIKPVENERKKLFHWSPIIAGGVAAGLVVTIVYPLDTLKTRIQSAQGFEKAGGFRGMYKGLLTLISASVPINCLFFGTYETIKSLTEPYVTPQYAPAVHLLAASFCRTMACLIRVPSEVAKQRKQISIDSKTESAFTILLHAYRREGLRRGVYRGFGSTVLRDLPYTLIEIPCWEMLKKTVTNTTGKDITSFQSGVCGLIAGGIAGSITTPLDLAKTRIVLADVNNAKDMEKLRVKNVLTTIYLETGVRGLFAGLMLRMALIMLGRFLFFGIYEELRKMIDYYWIVEPKEVLPVEEEDYTPIVEEYITSVEKEDDTLVNEEAETSVEEEDNTSVKEEDDTTVEEEGDTSVEKERYTSVTNNSIQT